VGVFDVVAREALRTRLVLRAQDDGQIAGAALLGSAARGEEDRWSDIDLALRLVPGAAPELVADAWIDVVAETELVVDHLDVHASGALYRVLLLGSTLQVDLSFWPYDSALAAGAPVEVLFGEVPVTSVEPAHADDQSMTAVRMGWLYALHARSALRRGRVWQALWMLEAIRDVVVGLSCRRLGLPGGEGRGVDRLPAELLAGLARSLTGDVEVQSVWAGFEALVGLLLAEAERQGLPVSSDLARVLTRLADHDANGEGPG
jgi:predicted nucleotidyltransferase